MKKLTITFLFTLFFVSTIFAQVDEENKSAFQLSFVPPLSTQGTQAPKYTNAVSINILAGVSKNVTSFSLSSLGMYVVNDLSGVHISGLGTIAGNNGAGIMISSLLNKSKDFQGFQLSGLLNLAYKTEGFQISGLGNIAKEDMEGFQISGLINSTKRADGFQVGGLINIASDVDGFQIGGLINVAKDVNGFQIATLLNIADNNDYPLGLVNIIKNNGEMSIGVTYNETGSTILSFRSGGRVLYGIVGVGFNHKTDKNRFVTEGGLGGHIPVSTRFRINNEIKSSYIIASGKKSVNHSSFSIMPAFKLLPRWEIFAGPSINYLESDHTDNIGLFPDKSLWKKYTDNRLQQLYLGFSVGTHLIF